MIYSEHPTKHSKPRRVAKRKGTALKNLGGVKEVSKKRTKQPPDTSRIPWFPSKSKIGTDA